MFAPVGDYVGVRTEIVGETLDTSSSQQALTFEPGVDVRIPTGPVDVLLRPTGAIGLTSDSPDWGIGGAVTVAWNPDRTH